MKTVIKHEKYGEIVYEEKRFSGRKVLSVNGVSLEKTDKTRYRMPNGKLRY